MTLPKSQKLSHEEMCEAWRITCNKYNGQKVKDSDVWLVQKMNDPVYWIMHGNKIVDRCNIYLDEMSWKYGDDSE